MKLLRGAAASFVVAAFGMANAVPVQAWARTVNLTPQDHTVAVARDSVGAAYLLGRRTTGPTNIDWVLMRFSPAGTHLWTRIMDGAAHGPDYPYAMTVDKFNNVWVAGSERYLTGDRAVVVKYSPAGAQLRKVWMNKVTSGYDAFYSIASDPAGNVTTTGAMNRVATGRDIVTLKLSQGGVLWYRYWTTTPKLPDEAKGVLTDAMGNVFVGGTYSSTPDNLNRNVVMLKYSAAGGLLWARAHTGPGTDDEMSAAALDMGGNPVFAVRESKGTYSTFSVHKRLSVSGNPSGVVFRYPLSTAWHLFPKRLVRDSLGSIYLSTTHQWRSGGSTYQRAILTRFSSTCARQWERYVVYAGADTHAGALLVGSTNNPVLFVTLSSRTSPASQMRALRFTSGAALVYNTLFGRPVPAVDAVADATWIGTTGYVGGNGKANLTTTNQDFTLYRLNNL